MCGLYTMTGKTCRDGLANKEDETEPTDPAAAGSNFLDPRIDKNFTKLPAAAFVNNITN